MSVRQLYLWCTRCDEDIVRCHCILMLILAYAVEPTRCAVHLKYCGKTEYRCGDDVVYIKTGTKPFTQNAYLSHVLKGHLSALHSCQIFRKPFKIILSSTLKKHASRLYGGTGLSSFHCIMILNEKVTLIFVIGFLCFELHCVYMMLFVSTFNYING